ncbi:hypothetical protein NA56DRAFT_647238 [Hyaloscypha hepaticicola]|uniref:Uncharacterized protein n=1 Tax=Hyaloscypha hepaticicola TaxID=2082293 RepID=A0A2J6PZS4_9HELO|nr:hypothetical protein NA56DRAFT_647238 [Hyaloscypha hepaticicola]
MDEATKLVSELQQKLTQLDQKVWQYRVDMESEFEKYEESLLSGVPKDVSETVSKTIAESKKGCRSLYPDEARPIESRSPPGSGRANGAGQSQQGIAPIMTAFQRQATDKTDDSPKFPYHEREQEFQGLFTPSYLPLLDSTSGNERRTSPPPPARLQDLKGKQIDMDDPTVDTSEQTSESSSSVAPEQTRPYTPKRRNTDSFSIASDWSGSEGTPRRSALRRSSSSKGTRVRFNVMGEEVLPTASPRPFHPIIPDEIYPPTYPDDEEDEESQPKRVSSSQRLRELSKSPLADDGTEWTTVMAPPDGSASVETNGLQTSDDEDEQLEIGGGSKKYIAPIPSDKSTISKAMGASDGSEEPAQSKEQEEEQADTFSDDEMVGMPPLRRQSASPASMLSPAIPQDISGNKSPTASTRSPGKLLHSLETTGSIPQSIGLQFTEEYQHDDLFRFDDDDDDDDDDDEDGGDNDEKKSPPPDEDEDESSSPDTTAVDDSASSPLKEKEPLKLSPYSSSPARAIIRPNQRANSEDTPSKGIVGSYKGRPFSMEIVSPEVHAMAASLGNFSSFVGSVHGRTGLDESDDASYIASFRGNGTPRSLSDRMRLEDIMEAEEQKRKGN